MWLTSSSIGRKFVMAITGVCLVLFLTFHVVMNAVCILWPAAYNQVCMFLGANWYALIASVGLAAIFIIHIIYAIWLTLQNRKARGNDPYAVNTLPPHVEWSSKNMLVLGFVVLAFLVVHLIQFWAKMQLQELLHSTATVDGMIAPPEFGTLFIQAAFSQIWVPIVYIIGFAALWFHMNHGFWSMFQTIGWNGRTWLPRLKCISCWWTSIVIGLFVIQAVVFTIQAKNNYYFENEALQQQYAEYFGEQIEAALTDFQDAQAQLQSSEASEDQQMVTYQQAMQTLYEKVDVIVKNADALCPKASNEMLHNAKQMLPQIQQMLMQMQIQSQAAPQGAAGAQPEGVEIEGEEEVVEAATEPQQPANN